MLYCDNCNDFMNDEFYYCEVCGLTVCCSCIGDDLDICNQCYDDEMQ